MKLFDKYIKISMLTLFTFAFAATGFAYVGDEYVTPDSWSKHATASGIKSSINGLQYGDGGLLKIGATTRINLKASDDVDWSIYEYVRLRYASEYVNINLNVRGAYDSGPSYNQRQFERFRDGLLTSSKNNNFEYRIYQGNVELNKLIPLTDIDLGRFYLETIDNYKIDGVNIKLEPSEYFNFNVFYGLPVSYYSNLNTQAAGAAFNIPIAASGTKIHGEYTYFADIDTAENYTHVAKLRLDQSLSFDALNGSIYAEGDMIGKAILYDAGITFNIVPSKTGLHAYISGQAATNDEGDYVNPYVSLYENILGSTKYIMGGVRVTQGIKDFLMVGVGYEGRFNFTESYGNRDYHRVYGNVDLIGLIHRNNYLSLLVNYYDIAEFGHQDRNTQLLAGLQMTQVFTDKIEAWLGVNVTNNRYNRTAIMLDGLADGWFAYNNQGINENTTVAYIGASYQPVDWFVLVADYSFEYADMFKSADLQPDVHTISVWANFIW